MKLHRIVIHNRKAQLQMFMADNYAVPDPDFDIFKNRIRAVFPGAILDAHTFLVPLKNATWKSKTASTYDCSELPGWYNGPLTFADMFCFKTNYDLQTAQMSYEIVFKGHAVDPLFDIPANLPVHYVTQHFNAQFNFSGLITLSIQPKNKQQMQTLWQKLQQRAGGLLVPPIAAVDADLGDSDYFDVTLTRNTMVPVDVSLNVEPSRRMIYSFAEQKEKVFYFSKAAANIQNTDETLLSEFSLDARGNPVDPMDLAQSPKEFVLQENADGTYKRIPVTDVFNRP